MAPLHGVTGRVFRNAFVKAFPGFDRAMAPFILSVDGSRKGDAHYKDLLPEYNRRIPVIPQVLSNDAPGFVSTAAVLADLGYSEVNWNLGCPYPMVTAKRRGSGLLPFPDLIRSFLELACAHSALPLSVKLRLGLDDRREIMPVIQALNDFPISRIIVHPRVGVQMYGGETDLDGFEEAARASRHPVSYNGDINRVADFDALRLRFPSVGEWMLGRGAISDPFLPSGIKGLGPPSDPIASIGAFHDDVYFGYREILSGQRHVLDKMKELWGYLGRSFGARSDSTKRPDALKAIEKATSFQAYDAAVSALFAGAAWKR
ncbi:MAG: tRNA-dihydrouridine synthase family protein [Spirochaetes bacterium]|nr:tRNA-dihydrouridine synthase family protein [Spirochaetota bacterium]MBU1079248.1 tRNA-dihydrouridine synthase family protein [Spirochaetota bacterium]